MGEGQEMKIIITGAAGFVGHHFVQYVLDETDWDIVILDKLSYASFGLERLREIGAFDNPRVLTLVFDFSQKITKGIMRELEDAEYIFHLGAESHVDNSVLAPEEFVMSNVLGTMNILEMARKLDNLKLMIYFSTDEVFGPAVGVQLFGPYDRYNARNPYSATKAGGEELAMAYSSTYGLPMLVVHCSNVFGIRQHPEKFIPLVIKKILNNETIQIHADPNLETIGSRYYIHAKDVASALLFLSRRDWKRSKVNIPGRTRVDNISMAEIISDELRQKFTYEIVGFRLGDVEHDLHYHIDGSQLYEMGWVHEIPFEESLREVIRWTAQNKKWLES